MLEFLAFENFLGVALFHFALPHGKNTRGTFSFSKSLYGVFTVRQTKMKQSYP